MDFKSLAENSIVHVLHKKPFKYETGILKSKTAKQQNLYQITQIPPTFDIVINVNGSDVMLPNVTDNMEVVDFKGCYYSASVEGILQANASLAQIAKTGIDEQPYYQSVLDGSEELKEKLNPQYAADKQQARTIDELVKHREETDAQLKDLASQNKEMLSMLRELCGSPKK